MRSITAHLHKHIYHNAGFMPFETDTEFRSLHGSMSRFDFTSGEANKQILFPAPGLTPLFPFSLPGNRTSVLKKQQMAYLFYMYYRIYLCRPTVMLFCLGTGSNDISLARETG
jgi:hypothetical protein